MSERLYPYVIFLPKDKKEKVLETIFGSKVSVNILKYSIEKGLNTKIFQKDLICKLGYSNKTIIGCLKSLVEQGVLMEFMEKAESPSRTVWLKYYVLTDLGKWFAMLLIEEEKLSREEKAEIARAAYTSYKKWIREFSEKLGISWEEFSPSN
ncbi:MAG: hypothetical protein RMJ07_05515 [Nitrososphaerota archaeon]|nr:hypothetical protein [Candidatus Bathyarchaeota archaeon]MDW8049120.1 hypothetical protein [Nitrososphaerota archaeon]